MTMLHMLYCSSETKAQSHYASLDLRQPVGDLYTIIDKHVRFFLNNQYLLFKQPAYYNSTYSCSHLILFNV